VQESAVVVIFPAVVLSLILVLLIIYSVRARRGSEIDDTRITSRDTLARLDALVRAGQDAEPHAALRR
jgi:uncharacterized membrane protein